MRPILQLAVPGSKREWPFVLLASCLVILGSFARLSSVAHYASPATRRSQISVVSELVLLPVNVTSAHGDFVPGLTQEDFRIYENDRLQAITLFQQEDSPVSLGLLVDHSGSMGSKLPNIVTAISAFTASSNPRDEMFVVNFGDDVSVALPDGKPFTNDGMEIQRAVSARSALGRTALYDAVAAGLSHLHIAHWQKRALLIVSDGGDNASRYRYSQILAQARESHVTIYSIGLEDETGEEQNPAALERLCKDTGGIAFFPRSAADVVSAATTIARDLQEQYTLGFTPQQKGSAGEFHVIEVRVAAPHRGRLHVRTRTGYTTPSSDEPSAKVGGKDPS